MLDMREQPRPQKPLDTQEKNQLLKSEVVTKMMTTDFAPERIQAAFTVETYKKFDPVGSEGITVDDRCYIHTESGNVYRLDRSRSRPTFVKVFNEKVGDGKPQYSAFVPGSSDKFAEVGKPYRFAVVDNADTPKNYSVPNTSDVKKIEIWRNYLKAQAEIEASLRAKHGSDQEGIGNVMAQAMKGAIDGRVRSLDYTKK